MRPHADWLALLAKNTWTRGVLPHNEALTCFACGLRFLPLHGTVNILIDDNRAFQVKVCAACAERYGPTRSQ